MRQSAAPGNDAGNPNKRTISDQGPHPFRMRPLICGEKTLTQTAVAIVGAAASKPGDVNGGAVLSASALAAVLGLPTSVAGLPEVQKE